MFVRESIERIARVPLANILDWQDLIFTCSVVCTPTIRAKLPLPATASCQHLPMRSYEVDLAYVFGERSCQKVAAKRDGAPN